MNLGHFALIVFVLGIAAFVWKVRDDFAIRDHYQYQCETVLGGEAFAIPDRVNLCLLPDGRVMRMEPRQK